MGKRTYKAIIKDIRGFSSENSQLSEELKGQLSKYADEIEAKSQDNKFVFFILLVLLIGFSIMLFLLDLENTDLRSDIQYKKSLIESYEKIIRFENDSTHSFTYRTRDDKPITYQDLMDENFDLLRKNSKLELDLFNKDGELRKINIYLDLARKNYGIKFIENKYSYRIEAPKVDSALLLLELYRDKIKYNPKDNTWSVSR